MRERKVLRQLGNVGMIVAGIGLIAWIIWAVGWPAIEANLAEIGTGWFVALVVLDLFALLAFMAGWWVLIDPHVRQSNFINLFGVFLAGDSVNYLIPSGNLAGEPVRAHLSRDALGLSHAVATVTVHKHAKLLAQWLFLVVGLIVSVWQFDLSTPVMLVAAAFVGGLGLGLLLMAFALRRGTFGPILNQLARWRPLSSRLKSYQPVAEAVDASIQSFYSRGQSRSLAAATGWCLIGWCGLLVETYLILRLLSPTAGWTTAVAVETLALILNSLLMFVPGRVGSAEGVRVGVFVLLGLPAAQGMAYGLVRRGRELIWIVPGLVVLLKKYGGRLGRLGFPEAPNVTSLQERDSTIPKFSTDRG